MTPTDRRVVIALAVCVLIAGVSGLALLRPVAGGQADSQHTAGSLTAQVHSTGTQRPTEMAVVCMGRATSASDDFCRRLAVDGFARKPLTPQQRAQVDKSRGAIQRALADASTTRCAAKAGACARVPPDFEGVRPALATAGFGDAIVRLARADDPAPVGSVLYAVPVEAGCVIGYLGEGGQSLEAKGTLDDGTCLRR